MRKALFVFLLSFVLMPAFANTPSIKFKAEVVEAAITEYVAQENRQQTATMYDQQIDDSGAITIRGLYKVCEEAGFNIYGTGNGFDNCRRFIEYMVSRTISKGQGTLDKCNDILGGTMLTGTTAQCVGKDGKPVVYAKACKGEAGKCITDFKGLATQTPTGKQFIFQWGKLQNPALTMTCANYPYETRRGVTSPLGQDFLQCTAGGVAYEFEFDSLNKTPSDASTASVNAAMCKLFGGREAPARDSTDKKFNFLCDVPGGCRPMQSFASTIGHSVVVGGYCMLGKDAHKNRTDMFLQTAFGIDNYVFFNYQPVKTRAEIAQKKLEEYLRTVVGNSSSVSCNPQIKEIQNMTARGRYIMTCYAGGQQIDFVFQNLTTASETRAMAGSEKMDCMIQGGNFTGKTCLGLNETQCNQIKRATTASCPECALARWDAKEQMCVLPNATSTAKLDKGLKIGGIVAGVTAGVVMTVFVGPGGIAMIVLVTAEATGGVIEIVNEVKMSGEAEKFLNESRWCKASACAEQYIKSQMQRLANLSNRFSGNEVQAIDTEFERLAGFLDENSNLFKEYEKKALLAANEKGFFDPASWEPEQVWAAIGLGLQFTSIASAILKVGATKALPKSTQMVQRKLSSILSKSKTLTKVDDALHITKSQKAFQAESKAISNIESTYKANVESGIPAYKQDINPYLIKDDAVRDVYISAYRNEQQITKDLTDVVGGPNANLHGLEYRMKTPESTMGKIVRDQVENVEKHLIMTDAEVAGNFKDIARYTYTDTPENLVEGTKSLVSGLEAKGYKQIGPPKNTFLDPKNPVDMINIRMESPTGQIFELQANTPHNLYIKDNLMHKPYEAWRVLDPKSPEAGVLMDQMLDIGKGFEMPKNIQTYQ
ncbi:MAG: hypothetical protein FWF97_04050 [Alphaproteobacteria bacterium]|nr:hypothetical protein [Alphaproteobacteria bacterium]